MSRGAQDTQGPSRPTAEPGVVAFAEEVLEVAKDKEIAPEELLDALATLVPGRQAGAGLRHQGGPMGHLDTERVVTPSRPERADRGQYVPLNLSVSTDLDGLIDRLAAQLGISKGEAILRGIALLKAATDAKREGKAVGAADSADALETEFVGFF